MDLSFLSDEKLQALQKGDLSSFTDDELKMIQGGQAAAQPDFETTLSQQTTKVELPPRLQEMKDYLDRTDPTSKEYKKISDAYVRERDDYLKLNQGNKSSQLSGDAAKILQIAVGGLSDIKDLQDEINKGNNLIGQALPFNIGDRFGGYLTDNLSDRLGRIRSGGAINEDELETFQGLVPGVLDFGKEAKTKKLQKLAQEFENIGRNIGGPRFESQAGPALEDLTQSFLAQKLADQVAQGGGLTADKQKRLEELRRKQAEGRLQ